MQKEESEGLSCACGSERGGGIQLAHYLANKARTEERDVTGSTFPTFSDHRQMNVM